MQINIACVIVVLLKVSNLNVYFARLLLEFVEVRALINDLYVQRALFKMKKITIVTCLG
jgi:hypothetical protein